MLLVVVGSFCLGVSIGWLVRYFLARFSEFNIKALSSVVSILAGGAVARFLGADPFRVAVWMYPIGVLAGILLYPLISMLDRDRVKTTNRKEHL